MPRVTQAMSLAVMLLFSAGCQSAPDRTPAAPVASESATPLLEVIERHGPEFLDVPGVVTAGEDVVDGRPVIVIFVEKLTPELVAQLPKEIEGHPVVVREDTGKQEGE